MNVLLKPHANPIFWKNRIFEINNGDNIFFGFKKKLATLNININTLDVAGDRSADCIVFCDAPLFWETNAIAAMFDHDTRKVLFCFESPLVTPLSHRAFFYRFFDRIYTWNDTLVDGKKVKKFHLPVIDDHIDVKEVPFRKKKMLCMINSNKSIPYPLLLLSPFRRDLYPERLLAIDFFQRNAPGEFDLYGRGWNEPKKFSMAQKILGHKTYTSYKWPIPRNLISKLAVLSKYKFTLCFENCIAPGYISEKIIDCFKAHTVPIYLGAPNIEEYIPRDCFIDARRFKNYASLLSYLISMDEKTYRRYISSARHLLANKKFLDTWFEEGFLRLFLKAIRFDKQDGE